jgi:hypothetical protein
MKTTFFPHKGNQYRPKFLNGDFLFYYATVLLLLKVLILPFIFSFSQSVFFADLTKTSLVNLANEARQEIGYSSLKENPVLSQAAYLKAMDMLEKGYFSHYSPAGVSPWHWLQQAGYDYRLAGENLAVGFLESDQVHTAWMNSLSHKENILNCKYEEIGMAVVKGNFQGKETALVVQFFGTPRVLAASEPLLASAPAVEELTVESLPVEEPEVFSEMATVQGEEISEEVLSEETDFLVTENVEEMVPVQNNSFKKTPSFFLFQFMTSDYYDLIQGIIYLSLALIILLLSYTVFCDIFIYHKFQIQYKDAIVKTVGFSFLWFVLVSLDKVVLIELINSQSFMIY